MSSIDLSTLVKSEGIDKLILSARMDQFTVNDYTNNEVWGRNIKIKQGESDVSYFSDLSGNLVNANNIYHNANKFNIDINFKGMRVIFNPSKFYHPTELISVNDKLIDSLNYLKTEMQNIGIDCDFNRLGISRFDYGKNEFLNQSLTNYGDALRLIKVRRTHRKEYPETYYIGNRQHEFTVYNKAMEHFGINYKSDLIKGSFSRFEVRAFKPKKVSDIFKIGMIEHLINIKPKQLSDSYKGYIKKTIFNSKVENSNQLYLDLGQELTNFSHLKTAYPKGYFNHWLMLNSIESIINNFGSLDEIEKFLYLAGENRTNVYRQINKIQSLIDQYSKFTFHEPLSPIELLNEIKMKIAS